MSLDRLPHRDRLHGSLTAPFGPLYVPLPQRNEDREHGKSLVSQAAHSGLTVELTVVAQGLPEMAEGSCSRRKGAGVNVVLNPVTPDVSYGPEFTKWHFATTVNRKGRNNRL
jgi:hypothetical protein